MGEVRPVRQLAVPPPSDGTPYCPFFFGVPLGNEDRESGIPFVVGRCRSNISSAMP